MKAVHEYVPTAIGGKSKIFGVLGIVGDQLTVERCVNAHNTLVNGFDPAERLDGLHFVFADWHGISKALEVKFFNTYIFFLQRVADTWGGGRAMASQYFGRQ